MAPSRLLAAAELALLLSCHPPHVEAAAASAAFTPPPFKTRSSFGQKKIDPSIEELESGIKKIGDAISGLVGRVTRIFRANRPLLLACGGTLGLMHGGTLCFTVLVVQSFGASGWPLVRKGVERGVRAYEEAKASQPQHDSAEHAAAAAPLRQRLADLAAELVQLRRDGASAAHQSAVIRQMRAVRKQLEAVPPARRAAPVLVAACEPSVVRDVLLGIWSGVTVSLAAACSSSARTIGVGVSLGEAAANLANAALARIEPALRKGLSVLPAEAVMLAYLGPSIFGSASLDVLGRAFGCWAAYRLQHLAAVFSVSLISARMLLEALAPAALLSSSDEQQQQQQAHAAGSSSSSAAVGEGGGDGFAPTADAATTAADGSSSSSSRALVSWARPIYPTDALPPRSDPSWLHPSPGAVRESIAWLLAIGSVQSQRGKGYRLPLYLRLPLLPLLGVEALLRRLGKSMAAEGTLPGPGIGGGGGAAASRSSRKAKAKPYPR